MDMDAKLSILEKLYGIYDDFSTSLETRCRQFCDHCCTRNVTMTTLEGRLIMDRLASGDRAVLLQNIENDAHKNRFSPLITLNRMADICAKGEDFPDEAVDPDTGPCPVIDEKSCPIYEVRPFGCRCMVSTSDCGKTGFAKMDEMTLSVNDIFMQYIEHIDARGFTGNFTDIMLFLKEDENRRAYMQNRAVKPGKRMVANQPVFVLMVQPEFREKVKPILKKIQSIRI